MMIRGAPWGDFWREIGHRTLNVAGLAGIVSGLPDAGGIKGALDAMASEPPGEDYVLRFLLLQAGSFGGKAVGMRGGRWVTHGFRSYWVPGPHHNRRTPVNPMMPMPGTLLARVREIAERCEGLTGMSADVRSFSPPPAAVAYIDPPYGGTTDYSGGPPLDVSRIAEGLGCPCYVSEARPLSDNAVLLSAGRRKGGISGRRAGANEEWLSAFNAPALTDG